jgi:prepilin signal peptidase PulO-like enzyme (type II secretory pathway)
MGILLLILNYEFQISNLGQLVVGIIIVTLLVFSFVFDLKYMILPDFSTFILIGIAVLGAVFDEKNIIPYLLSAVGASLFLLFLNIITKGKGMGMGDVKYAIFMGLLLGFPLTVVAMYIAFIGGAIVGVFLILNKKLKRKSLIPFGPFLIIGTVVAWWWGGEIVKIINSKF